MFNLIRDWNGSWNSFSPLRSLINGVRRRRRARRLTVLSSFWQVLKRGSLERRARCRQKLGSSSSATVMVERLEHRTLLSSVSTAEAATPITDDALPSFVPDEVLVGFRTPQMPSNIAAHLASLELTESLAESRIAPGEAGPEFDTVYTIPVNNQTTTQSEAAASAATGFLTVVRFSLSTGTDVLAAAASLAALDGVVFAEPNYYVENGAEFTPDDPQFSNQYHHTLMQNTLAWDTTLGSSDVIIAITDNGFDWSHADLEDNIWTNSGEIAGNGIDDDNNGFIDDVRGWDFVGNDNDPYEPGGSGHGTFVAGVAAADTNNAIGVAGTAGGSTIMPLRFGGSTASDFSEAFYLCSRQRRSYHQHEL